MTEAAAIAAGLASDERRRWNEERVRLADRDASQRERGGVLPENEQRRIEPGDGDERRVGTITAEVPMARGERVELTPAPPDHPGWGEQILVPPTPGDLGLLVARDLDAALRDRG